jgi:hypothetical protein
MFQGRNPLTIAQRPPANLTDRTAELRAVSFYLKDAPAGPVQIEISSMDGARTFSANVQATAGINRYFWPLRFTAPGAVVRAAAEVAVDVAAAVRAVELAAVLRRCRARRWWRRPRSRGRRPPDPDAPPPVAPGGGAAGAEPGPIA